MTTKTQVKRRDNKYKVIPNLTPKGKDIKMRMKNRSLNLDFEGEYTDDPEVVNAKKLSRVEIANKALQNQNKILTLQGEALEKAKKGEEAKRQNDIKKEAEKMLKERDSKNDEKTPKP